MQQLRRFLTVAFFATAFAAPVQAQQTCGNQICEQGEDESNCPTDCAPSPICGDLICQPGAGEDALSCPSDCQPAGPVCGNNTCEAGEDIASCPADCGSQGPVCGNSSCESGEDAQSCPVDCAGGGPVCGDNVCTPDLESCGNCAQDCPCWMPGTTCNPNPAPGVCENVCGNGLCGPGENAGNCSEDCPVQCGDSICSVGESCPADCAGCGDGFCDAGLGENDLSCSQDCSGGGACTVDGVCDAGAGENQQSCSPDCGGGPSCDFDNVCEAGENANSCPSDCSTSFVCGDNVCTPFVESCGNCPQDCPCALGTTCNPNPAPGICVAGPQLCGNGVLDPGETCENCLRDASSRLRFTLSTTTPQVGESVFLTPDFTTVGDDPLPRWDLGNGTSVSWLEPAAVWYEPGTYPVVMRGADLQCFTTQFSDPVFVTVSGGGGGACNNNGACDALENALNCPSDCTAPTCDFTDLPPNLQICCGDGICDSGENPNRCARDCPASCGDGLCSPMQGENSDTCAQDCCFSGITCAAGCAPMSTFEISPPNGQVSAFEEVTFTGSPDNIAAGSNINWDFGDGHHCEGVCGFNAVHRYERIGTFEVRMHATDSVCGQTVSSFPQYVVVGMPPPRDDAQVLVQNIPACVPPTGAADVSVTMRNVGGTTWSGRNGEALALYGFFTPLSAVLPLDAVVPPGAQHEFRFSISSITPVPSPPSTLLLQMRNGRGLPFGDTAMGRIEVRSDCPAVSPPIPTGDYTCAATLTRESGAPAGGVHVVLEAFGIVQLNDGSEETARLVTRSALTDARGVAHLAFSRSDFSPAAPVQRVSCRALDVVTIENPSKSLVDPVDVPSGHLDLTLTLAGPPKGNRLLLPGLNREYTATAELISDGAYDKPIVIPTPFDGNERTSKARTPDSLRDRFRRFIEPAVARGYDVWLMHTLTGQNIHEQSAEFAQLLNAAANRLGPDGKVVVAGYSLGGVNARLTTARFQSDVAWRRDLGVSDRFPVNMIVFGDAPLRGAHINYGVQDFTWSFGKQAESNLNSCGSQQLLKRSIGGYENAHRFFESGAGVEFGDDNDKAQPWCERFTFNGCACDGGPPLFGAGLNGDGWAAGVPIIAFSDGTLTGSQECYGDERDHDEKKNGVCTYPGVAAVGDILYRKTGLVGPFAPEIRATADDLIPGSRLFRIDKEPAFGILGLSTVFSPVFIPTESAVPANSPFVTSWANVYNGVHGETPDDSLTSLFNEISLRADGNFGGTASSAALLTHRPVDSGSGSSPVSVAFPNVYADGETALTIAEVGPPPVPRHTLGLPAQYFEISSTVVFDANRNNPIVVCVDYSTTTFMDDSRIGLFHFEAGAWTDITSFRDTGARRLCGATTSLSPFAVFEPTNELPVAHAGPDLAAEASSAVGALVRLSAAGSFDPDLDDITFAWSSGAENLPSGEVIRVPFSIGDHEITLRVIDARGGAREDVLSVAVRDTTPPTALLSLAGGTTRTISVSATDAVGVASVQFFVDGAAISPPLSASPYSVQWDTTAFSDGPHVLTATAIDTSGNRTETVGLAVVVDNTPPTMTISVSPSVVWPPNKRLTPITVDLVATDSVDSAPAIMLESVTCDDGCDPGRDIVGAAIGTNDRSFTVRADRRGGGSGRTYRMTYRASDAAGNSSQAAATVLVPHDRR